jgi:DMSO/TMAO reductase YedYZ heme-binding membrane subunit
LAAAGQVRRLIGVAAFVYTAVHLVLYPAACAAQAIRNLAKSSQV